MSNSISQAASLMGKKGAAQRNKNLSPERKKEIATIAGRASGYARKKKKKYFSDGCEIRPMTKGEKEIAKGLDELFDKSAQKPER